MNWCDWNVLSVCVCCFVCFSCNLWCLSCTASTCGETTLFGQGRWTNKFRFITLSCIRVLGFCYVSSAGETLKVRTSLFFSIIRYSTKLSVLRIAVQVTTMLATLLRSQMHLHHVSKQSCRSTFIQKFCKCWGQFSKFFHCHYFQPLL